MKEVKAMASQIAGIRPCGGDLPAQTGTVQPEATAKGHTHDRNAATRSGKDAVTLSISAKARELKEQGASDIDIANRLNVDVKTLERCLDIPPESDEAKALRMRQQGESISQIADCLGVDVKTIRNYLGVMPVPATTQAQQLKQQGESILEIANRLGVDVRTVRRYLGATASPWNGLLNNPP